MRVVKYLKFLYDKWVKGKCRHICRVCEYKEQCYDDFNIKF